VNVNKHINDKIAKSLGKIYGWGEAENSQASVPQPWLLIATGIDL